MCGIVGIVRTGAAATPADRDAVERATRALVHRGPDDGGVYVDGPAVLGHRRLAIVDVDGGSQPICSEDGSIAVVFNGEIWNHDRLRERLERLGHRFATRCDTEAVVHGYEEWGSRVVDELDGMFAFAVWDAALGRLLLARDRVGKKPLYLLETPEGVAFGSDARGVLLAARRAAEIDPGGVAEFLFQRYTTTPRTLFAGVRRLPPGHTAVVEDGRVSERPYWSLEPARRAAPAAPELRELLHASVAARLMGDEPVGVLLSGGVDSSAVLGLMREAGAAVVPSFTVGFRSAAHDERAAARIAVERFDADHHELELDSASFVETLPRLAWYRDEPIAEPSEVPLLQLAELAGAHVKVVLTGDGGDELFGGYPKYRAERVAAAVSYVPDPVLAVAAAVGRRLPSHRRLDRALETFAIRDRELRWASWFRSFSPAELSRLLSAETLAGASQERLAAPVRAVVSRHPELDGTRAMLLGDMLTYLPDNMLLRGDKVLMAASVEGRTPLLDRRIVEAVVGVSGRERSGFTTGKTLLRSAVADLVPPEILNGPKRGFPVPVAELLSGDDERRLQRLLLSERALSRGLLRADAVRAFVEDGRRTAAYDLKLFTLASLELWARINVDDGERLAPPDGWDEILDSAPALAA